jgi:hypothetical protein
MRRMLSLLALLLAAFPARAAEPIDAEEFWARLAQTEMLLASDPVETEAVLALWADLEAVRLADGRVMPVDVGWIAAGLAGDSEDLQRQMRALLNYHAQDGDRILDEGLSLAVLAEVLRDPRFQYADATPFPTPSPEPTVEIPVADSGSSLPQLVLIVVGVIVLMAVLLFVSRGLQVQPTALTEAAEEDDPTTSGDARTRAEGLEAERDYRSAIRYLYLSSLLLLDERGVIRYDRTLTNREHLRQVAGKQPLYDLLRTVINAFEDVWYGFEPVDERFYRQYNENVEQLRRMVSA